jgi:hypothetical protein
MKHFFLCLTAALALASCSGEQKTEENILKTPEISRFRIEPDGNVVLLGSGFGALSALDVDYDFSITMNEAIGESSLICLGKHYTLSGDTAMIISPRDLEDSKFFIRDKKFSPEVKSILDQNGGATEGSAFALKKQHVQPILKELAKDKDGCTLWLSMKDHTKTFWREGSPKKGFTLFAHYELYSHVAGDQAGYNEEKLYWKPFKKEN